MTSATTLKSILEDFLLCQAEIESPATIEKYHNAIKALRKGLDREPTVADLTKETIVRAIKRLPIANSTRNSYLSPIRRLWTWCYERTESLQKPDLPKFTVKRNMPVALTQAQMTRLAREIAGYRSTLPSGVRGDVFFRALFGLMALNGGERIGAVLQIEKAWVDLGRGTIMVPSEVRKTGDWHLYHLRDDVLEWITKLYHATDSELLFASGLTYHALLSRWKTILKRAKLEPNRKYTFHGLRRTCYTHLRANGADAHASFKHSRNLSSRYDDPRIGAKNNTCNRIPFKD